MNTLDPLAKFHYGSTSSLHVAFLLLLIALMGPFVVAKAQSDLEKQMDQLLSSYRKDGQPGASLVVKENGSTLARKTYGLANIEHGVPFSSKTAVRLMYSEGREFMMTAAVLLEKDRKLSLDDKVAKYFPELPKWSANVSIRDLMNHRSGFIDEWAAVLLTQNSMINRFDESQFLRLLADQPRPEIEPGKGYLYSNSDMGLLKMILEKAAGQTLREWMRSRMFGPLGMTSTNMYDEAAAILPSLATLYEMRRTGPKFAGMQKSSPGANYSIVTTAEDMEIWDSALSDENSEIARASSELFRSVRLMPGKSGHYIFGMTKEKIAGHDVFFHNGIKGYTYLARVPSLRMSVIGTTNNYSGIGDEIRALVGFLLKEPLATHTSVRFPTTEVPVSAEVLRKYVGRYLWQDQEAWQSSRQVRRISELIIVNGVLNLRYEGELQPLIPVGKDIFYFNDGYGCLLEFSTGASGEYQLLMKFDDDGSSIRKVRESVEIWQPNREQLAKYVGKYYSRHLDYYWRVILRDDGKLVLRRPTVSDKVLEPDGRDRFTLEIDNWHDPNSRFTGWIIFHPAGARRSSYLTVGFARLMDLRFDRVAN